MSVFSKCLRPSFPLHFYPFLPQSHPRPLCFCFFPTVPCSICCEKASRVFWGQIKRGNESRQKRETGIKNLDKKNKDIFTRMTHLRNNAARSQTITDEKQMSWKKFQRKDWKIKTSALKTKRCGHCVMIQVSPSFFHFSDLQCFLNYLWAPAEAYRLFPHCPGC